MTRIIVWLGLALVTAAAAQAGEIRVLDAFYGSQGRRCDAQAAVARECERRNFCQVRADNELCGDPRRRFRKELVVSYSCGDGLRTLQVNEGEYASIYCLNRGEVEKLTAAAPAYRQRRAVDAPPARTTVDIEVMEAFYGHQARFCDATQGLANACEGRIRCAIQVNNQICGDPSPGHDKELMVEYRCGLQARQVRFAEGEVARLSCAAD